MNSNHHNLSDSRGNALGIGFFKVCMHLFGLHFCCAFVWFVAFFYALFDCRAFHAARNYLLSRFPHASTIKLKWHFYRLIVSQGQAIIMAYWLQNGHHLEFSDETADNITPLTTSPKGGIILISHVGCWHAALPRMTQLKKRINLLIQENQNDAFKRLFNGEQFNVISNQSDFGGLLQCTDALQRGEIICIMGDRLPDDVPTHLTITLHGRTVRIPEAPWYLAARCQVPIYAYFPIMQKHHASINYISIPPISIPFSKQKRPKPQDLQPFLIPYQKGLEDIINRFPYQVFHFDVSN